MIRKFGIGMLALLIAVASVAFTEKEKSLTPKQGCVWYLLNRTALNPNPNIEINTNYVKITPADIHVPCPSADIICAVCLPANGSQTFPAASNFTNAYKLSLHAAEAGDVDQATIELFER